MARSHILYVFDFSLGSFCFFFVFFSFPFLFSFRRFRARLAGERRTVDRGGTGEEMRGGGGGDV